MDERKAKITYRRVKGVAREFGLQDSLRHIWAYTLHICYGFRLPFEYQHSNDQPGAPQIRKNVHEFHLDLLLREIMLHAGPDGRSLRSLGSWGDLAELQNAIHSQIGATTGRDRMLILHRIGHQQITTFDPVNSVYIGRYWSLFRRPNLSALLERHFGMTSLEYFLFAVAAFTVFMKKHAANLVDEMAALEIDAELIRDRINALVISPDAFRASLRANMRFDGAWAYTFNEIDRTPLIRLNPDLPDVVSCPRPPLLVRRLLSGAYFDLVTRGGFDKAFGDAVDEMAGEVIVRIDARLKPSKPLPYATSSGRRHGADWRLEDETGVVFVECKSARVPLKARIGATAQDITEGMDKLASAIVQNYNNIRDALAGLTEWQPRDVKTYSLIVTLEDWNMFSPIASQALQNAVRCKLDAKGIHLSIIEEAPYFVVPLRDLANIAQAMANERVATVLDQKRTAKYSQYLMAPFLEETGRSSAIRDQLFRRDTDELFNEFASRFHRPA